MPAGVNRTDGSQRGTSTSLGLRTCFFVSKKARYFSRISSVFMDFAGQTFLSAKVGARQAGMPAPPTRQHTGATKKRPDEQRPPLAGTKPGPGGFALNLSIRNRDQV